MRNNIVVSSLLISGGKWFRRENAHAKEINRRIGVLTTLAASCVESDLVLLPAGFFSARGEAAARLLAIRAHRVLQAAHSRAIFVYGVDAWLGDKALPLAGRIGYPFFVAISIPNTKGPRLLRQIATAAAEGRDISLLDERWVAGAGVRSIAVGRNSISVLICGETWSQHLHTKVAEGKPSAVLIAAHRAVKTGKGSRSWIKPLRKLVRHVGAPVILAEHTRSGGTHKRVWGKVVKSVSEERPDLYAHLVTTILAPRLAQ